MNLLVLALASAAFAGHGRRVHTSLKQMRNEEHKDSQSWVSSLARVIPSLEPAAAWHPQNLRLTPVTSNSGSRQSQVPVPRGLALMDEPSDEEEEELSDTERFVKEIQTKRKPDLMTIARQEGTEAGVNWEVEELNDVIVTTVNSSGLYLDEIICNYEDARCISINVPIPWPKGMPISKLPEMRKAFTALSRKANFAVGGKDEFSSEYEEQQSKVDHIMTLVNEEFSPELKWYAFTSLEDAMDSVIQVDAARLTQLNYEGFTIELDTTDARLKNRMTNRRVTCTQVWSVSVAFDEPCTSPEGVEKEIIKLLTVDYDTDAIPSSLLDFPDR